MTCFGRRILAWLRLVMLPAGILVVVLILLPKTSQHITKFSNADRYVEQLGIREFNQDTFSRLSIQFPPELQNVKWTQVRMPDFIQLPMVGSVPDKAPIERVWFRMRYTMPNFNQSGEQVAIFITRIMGGECSVWLNGELVNTNLDNWRMQWNTPLFAILPMRSIPPGQSVDIYVAIPYIQGQGYAVGSVSIGPATAIRSMYNERVFWQSDLPRAGLLVAIILGLLSFQFWLSRRGETAHLLLGLTALAWFIYCLQYFFDFSDTDIGLKWYAVLVDSAISWVVVFSNLFAFRFCERRFPKLEKFLILYAASITLITLPIWSWHVNGLILQHTIDLMVGIPMELFILWLAFRHGSLEFRLLAAAIWSITLLGMHDYWITGQVLVNHYHLLPYCSMTLFGAFMFAINRRYIQALHQAEELNVTLDHKVKAREEELQKKHALIQELEREQTRQDERQRLTRDIHDCIGSRLITSQIEVNNGNLTVEQIGDILQSCIDDLRLVIESREVGANDLPTLLGMIRYRLNKSMSDTGINIDFQVPETLPLLAWLEPSSALNIMRILVEALTNVQKHASASRVTVCALNELDELGKEWILLSISDNGNGFDTHSANLGRGLKNMQFRTHQVSGQLAVSSTPGIGTMVLLRLPVECPKI